MESSEHLPSPFIMGNDPISAWKVFKLQWNNYLELSGLKNKDVKIQVIENTSGDDATNVYMAFQYDDPGNKTVSDIMSAFDTYIKGETNDTF